MNSPSPPRRGPDARALAERLTGALDSASGLVLLEAESQALAAAGRRSIAPVLGRAEIAGDRMTVRWPGYDELTIDGDFPA